MTVTDLALTGESRVFFARDLAGPTTIPTYKGKARSGGLTWDNGALTPVRIPSADRFDQFDTVETIQGQQDLPQLPIMFRYPRTLSELLEIFRVRCPIDLEVHWGKCGRPDDYLEGWVKDGKIIMVDLAHPLNYTTDDLGTFDADGQAAPIETVNFTGLDLYEVVALQPALQAGTEITDPIIAVVICDAISCGACGIPSDGCQKVFALSAASPGVGLEVIFTSNQGQSYGATNINSAGAAELGHDMKCVGPNLMAVTMDDQHHYADIDDVLNGVDVWTSVSTGYVGAGTPNRIFSLSRQKTWIAADAGYIYFSEDITAGVTVQTPGDVSANNLVDIHGNESIILAVGVSNTVLVTESEGLAWSSVTGPSPAVDLSAVEVISELTWFIGNANGDLYFTVNGGISFAQLSFPGDGDAATITDIAFVNRRVGYMAHGQRVLRTWNGGHDWVVEPQNSTFTFPTNTGINRVAVCESDPNLYFAGGVDTADGVLIKGAAVK